MNNARFVMINLEVNKKPEWRHFDKCLTAEVLFIFHPVKLQYNVHVILVLNLSVAQTMHVLATDLLLPV